MFSRRNKTPVVGQTAASTASYLSDTYDSLGAGTAEDNFYGIPLSKIGFYSEEVTLKAKIGLVVLVVILLLKSRVNVLKRLDALILFWIIIGYAAFSIKEIALYPLVSTIVLTRTTYPWLVVIPHCVLAAAAYRKQHNSEVHYLSAFVLGFFCYGFGGSIVSDVLMGLPATALGHARILPSYILGWTLVWFSPFDIVYKLLTDQASFVRYFMNACEAVDAVTTPMGRISRSARELQNKMMAPIVAGVLAGTGGAVIRYWERVILRSGDHHVAIESFKAIEAGLWRNLVYSVLWWYIAVYQCVDANAGEADRDDDKRHCREYNGNNLHRFVIVSAHVLWMVGCDFGVTRGHPFVYLSQKIRDIGAKVAVSLNYGPPAGFKQLDAGEVIGNAEKKYD